MDKFYSENMVDIYCGHVLDIFKQLPDESVQMTMTSPPYWGLRNYAGGEDIVWGGDETCQHEWTEETQGLQHENRNNLRGTQEEVVGKTGTAFIQKYDRLPAGICVKCGAWRGQLGLEPTPELYVEHLMMIFREVKRVLRDDGSFYLNIGDTYAGSGIGYGLPPDPKWPAARNNQDKNLAPRRFKDLPPKCMVCIPERVMFAMVEEGWILRNKIIWHKPNSMPSSVKDRFTTTWEYLYFFTKARKYYFDLDAVREPHKTLSLERYQGGVNLDRPAIGKSAEVGPMQQYKRAPQWFQEQFPPDQDYKGKFDDLFGHGPQPQSFNLRVRDVKRGKGGVSAQGGALKASEKEIEEYEYPEKHHGSSMTNQDSLHQDRTPRQENIIGHFEEKGSGGHYLYGGLESPEGEHNHPKGKNPGNLWSITTKPSSISVCPQCETVFSRLVKVCPNCKVEGIVGHFAPYPEGLCVDPIKASSRPGDVVLDPFAGGGTTAVAAKKLGRKSILIDCVRAYCIMARYKFKRTEYQPDLIQSSKSV